MELVFGRYGLLSLMEWMNWRRFMWERIVSQKPAMTSGTVKDRMVNSESPTVQSSNAFILTTGPSLIIIRLKSAIFPFWGLSMLVQVVSSVLHLCHWLVWIIEWFDWIDLPILLWVMLCRFSFYNCRCIRFESDGIDSIMIQICQSFNTFILVMIASFAVVTRMRGLIRSHWMIGNTPW